MNHLAIILLKIAIPLAAASLAAWIIVYSRLQPWWHDQIGITLVSKSVMVIAQLILLALAIFFTHMTPAEMVMLTWGYVVVTILITPIMIWRTIVWIQVSRAAQNGRHAAVKEEAR